MGETGLNPKELYWIEELFANSKQLKVYFGLEVEVDHAKVIFNPANAGAHYPDNFQLLLKAHNAKKPANNWERFNLEEQINCLNAAITLQTLVIPRMGITVEPSILDTLFERLKVVYFCVTLSYIH